MHFSILEYRVHECNKVLLAVTENDLWWRIIFVYSTAIPSTSRWTTFAQLAGANQLGLAEGNRELLSLLTQQDLTVGVLQFSPSFLLPHIVRMSYYEIVTGTTVRSRSARRYLRSSHSDEQGRHVSLPSMQASTSPLSAAGDALIPQDVERQKASCPSSQSTRWPVSCSTGQTH